jgi:DNA-binding transcriptional MocR family regulator
MPIGRRDSPQTLVEDCVQWAQNRIHGQVFRPGMRLPSIRALARERGISPFTVVEAYERLVASGYLVSRKGSGFYVRERKTGSQPPTGHPRARIDLNWLMRNMLADSAARGPGLGVLPASWLDGVQLGAALRSIGRQSAGTWLESGKPLGFEPLRSVLQQRLAARDILARPAQIVLTTGITHALDLVLRTLVSSDDTVLVLDPCWFGALGMLAARGIRTVGVPCTSGGPDLAAMERLATEEKPRLLIINSSAQNPTGASLGAAAVRHILDIAARFDFLIFEDDVYTDLCGSPTFSLAASDHLNRVIYAASFSKTLASNIRVGYIACRPELADSLAETKILSGFTTPEINERLVHKLLVEGRYTRHVRSLRDRLAECRIDTKATLSRRGVDVLGDPSDGMFLWIDMHTDTDELAVSCREKGLLLAPGSLFSPHQSPSTWMRLNMTTPTDAVAQCLHYAELGSRPRAN